MQFNLYTLLLLFSFALSVSTGYYAQKQKNSKERNYLFALIISTGWWVFFAILESISVALPFKLFFSQIKYIGITTAPVFVFLFILKYTQTLVKFKPGYIFLLFTIPIMTMIGIFTNPIYHLQWVNATMAYQSFSGATVVYMHGINFWIIVIYSYILVSIGLFILIKTSFKYPKQYAAQVIIILFSFMIPVGATVGYLALGENSVRIDISPMTFPVAGFLLLAGMRLYGLLKVRPIANDYLFNSMQDGVIYVDMDEQIIDLNKSAAKILKVRFDSDVAKTAKKRLNAYPGFYKFYTSSTGVPMEFELSGDYFEMKDQELKGKGNDTVGKVIVFRNITEQRASKAIIQTQNDELNKLNRQKDKMFSIISHDLRSPFSSIIGLAEIMLEQDDVITEEERKKILSLFLIRTKTTYDLVENLLLWSKSQNGGLERHVNDIDLRQLIKNTISIYEPMANDKQIQLTVVQNLEVQPTILGNDQLLMTVLRNLTTNAIKFTPEKGEISVSYKYLPDHYEICVADTGIGIPSDKLNNLFDFEKPFYTLGTRNETGSGLGLNLCYEFVKKMGGEIWINSELGKGTSIYFSLPYRLSSN